MTDVLSAALNPNGTVESDDANYRYGFHMPENYVFKSRRGLTHEIVEEISHMKGEPDWMRKFRLRSLDIFLRKAMPQWGGNLNDIDFDNIFYNIKPTTESARSWDD